MSESINDYETATKIRNLEIKLFWQRSNYFLVLNTAIATGTLLKIDSPEYAFPLSVFGFVVSLMWISINLGGKFWQDRWERKLAKIELTLDSAAQLFAVPRDVIKQEVKESLRYDDREWYQIWRRMVDFLVLRKPSVSRTMILLSFSFSIFWIGVAFYSMGFQFSPPSFKHLSTATCADTLCQSAHPTPATTELPWFISWDSFWHFIAIVAGVLFAFWLERRVSAKENLSVQKSLVQLIADEVEGNIRLMSQMVNQANESVIPYYQLVSKNKDACWSILVQYPFSANDLIKGVSSSYFEYQLINRTLDMLFFKEGLQGRIFADSTIPLCKAEMERSKQLLQSLRDWANR